MTYKVWHASSTGSSHARLALPCQDACSTETSADGKWLSIISADGCGSAANAQEGAQFVSSYLAEHLLTLASALANRGPGEWVIDKAVVLLADLREALRSRFGGNIRDSAATIVGALISQSGGFLMHVGDGIASSLTIRTRDGHRRISVVGQSNPENGEFINETSYVTDPDWIRHVRITPLSDIDCLVLCTDGAQSLFYESNRPFGGALIPLLKLLATSDSAGDHSLERVLANPEAASISSDDKTIAIVARAKFLEEVLLVPGNDIECADGLSGLLQRTGSSSNDDRLVSLNPPPSNAALRRHTRRSKKLPWYQIAVVGVIVIVGIILGAPHVQSYVCPMADVTANFPELW